MNRATKARLITAASRTLRNNPLPESRPILFFLYACAIVKPF